MESTGHPGDATNDEKLPAKFPPTSTSISSISLDKDGGDVGEEDEEVGEDGSSNNS